MAKFHGVIGFITSVEKEIDIWEETIEERDYVGIMERRHMSNVVNDEISHSMSLSNVVSILADDYLKQNFMNALYITFNNQKLSITNSEIEFPRITFTIGGRYIGQ